MTDQKPERKKPDVLSLIKKAAADEKKVLSSPILAPVVPGTKVRVRINGLIHELEPNDRQFEGWAILQATGLRTAAIVQPASPQQIKKYLELLPRFQLVAITERDDTWWGIPAQLSDSRMQIFGAVRIRLAQRVSSFETINTRFDGTNFWFEEPARRRNPVVARRLRDALAQDVFPEDLQIPELVPQERAAYSMLFFALHPELIDAPPAIDVQDEENDSVEPPPPEPVTPTFDYKEWWTSLLSIKLHRALDHAGARLDTYWRDTDGIVTVRMVVDDQLHVVQLRNKDLTVLSSGICLSGRDADFDLASLVGVLREHSSGGRMSR